MTEALTENAFEVALVDSYSRKWDLLKGYKSMGYSTRLGTGKEFYRHPGLKQPNFMDLELPCSGGLHVCPYKVGESEFGAYSWGDDVREVYFLRESLILVHFPGPKLTAASPEISPKWKVSALYIPEKGEELEEIQQSLIRAGCVVYCYRKHYVKSWSPRQALRALKEMDRQKRQQNQKGKQQEEEQQKITEEEVAEKILETSHGWEPLQPGENGAEILRNLALTYLRPPSKLNNPLAWRLIDLLRTKLKGLDWEFISDLVWDQVGREGENSE